MITKYRGDTFIFPFSFEDSSIKFEVGDTIKFGIKLNTRENEYILQDTKQIEEESDEISFRFEPELTRKICAGTYLVEVEVTKGNLVETSFRDSINIKEDIINE